MYAQYKQHMKNRISESMNDIRFQTNSGRGFNRLFLLHQRRRTKIGRAAPQRMDDRKSMNGIFYVLRTGCQWKALPKSLGAASTVHDRFQE
jgi:transposase